MKRIVRSSAVTVLVGLAVAAAASPAVAHPRSATHPRSAGRCVLPVFGPGAAYHPAVHPSDFRSDVTNRFFPLPPGRTYVYAGTKDGKKAINVFAPSRRTAVVDGVRTRVVNDRLYLDGVLEERTTDYYAQDRCGNVWYFGEDTATLDGSGRVVSTAGSFRAGVHGAQPGVYMQSHPQLRRTFRQEWSPGNAEDQFSSVARDATVSVAYGTFRHALRTKETTSLEPAVVDNKYYVAGIGQVEEVAVRGPLEKLVLVDVLK